MEPPRCRLTCYTFKKHSQAVGYESLVVQALLPGPDTFRSHLTQADFQSTACKDAEGGWRLEASLGLPGLTQALPGPRRLQESFSPLQGLLATSQPRKDSVAWLTWLVLYV